MLETGKGPERSSNLIENKNQIKEEVSNREQNLIENRSDINIPAEKNDYSPIRQMEQEKNKAEILKAVRRQIENPIQLKENDDLNQKLNVEQKLTKFQESIFRLQDEKNISVRKTWAGIATSVIGAASIRLIPSAIELLSKNLVLSMFIGNEILVALPILATLGIITYGGIKTIYNALKTWDVNNQIKKEKLHNKFSMQN